MTQSRSDAKKIFLKAIALESPTETLKYVENACGDDAELRDRVEALLRRAHQDMGKFLGGTAQETASVADPDHEMTGKKIGLYKLLQQIGEGGFGVVYMAEQQEPLRRRVALKIIKPGMDSKQVIARFEAERQALALMDHQNIARVFDAGTTGTGRPYFVMELVRGVPITEYCDRNKLTVPDRLALFVQVCNAVQHAHQKGIVHRDIKPSNVIVTIYDGRPEAKVIDFGVAKAIERPLTEKTMFTAYGQMIGTIEYMSPEQAEMGGLDIDTRADIYSLGVLLYELLTGSTPISKEKLRNAAFDEMLRTIREEEPPRPSLRLQQTGDSLAEVSAMRQVDPARLSRFVKGDLDWIVMKSLEKDRTRRYETANALSSDVQRYLTHDAVDATPPSSLYRLRKFARKNKKTLTIATAFVLLLTSGTAISIWLAVQNSYERQAAIVLQKEAVQQRDLANRATEKLESEVCSKDMILAGHAWSVGNINRVTSLLSHHVPNNPTADRRTFEWYLMWGLSQRNLLDAEQYSFHGMTNALAVSSDGSRLAVGHENGGVTLFDLKEREKLERFGTSSPTWRPFVAFLSDDRQLTFIDDASHGITVRDLNTGQERVRFPHSWPSEVPGEPERQQDIREFQFSQDRKLVATATADYAIRLWDASSDELLNAFTANSETTAAAGKSSKWQAICFSQDNTILAAARPDHSIKLWNVDTFTEVCTCVGHTEGLRDVTFSPDGNVLASCGSDGRLRIWDAKTGMCIHRLWDSHQNVACVTFSEDGSLLAAGGQDNTVRVWDTDTMMEREVLRGHSGTVISVAFLPGTNGDLLSGCTDKRVIRWKTASIERDSAFAYRGNRGGISLSPNGQHIVSCWEDQVHIRDWSGKSTRLHYDLESRPICAAVTDAKGIAVYCDDGWIRIFESASVGGSPVEIPVPNLNIKGLKYSADARVLAATSSSGNLLLIDPDEGLSRRTSERHTRSINVIASSPCGSYLATGSHDRTLKLWDIESGDCVRTVQHDGSVRGIAFSPNGKELALGGFDPTLAVVDLTDPTSKPRKIEAHNGGIASLAYSHDGAILASGGQSGSFHLWEADTLKHRLSLTPYRPVLLFVAFSPDCQTVLTAYQNGTARFMRAATKEEVEAADWLP